MTGMAYVFAMSYLNQYPSEKVGPSTFSCDTTIRNAKFQSSLQPLTIPVSSEEQPMFDMLNEQNFTLHLDFINTAASCQTLSIVETTDSAMINLNLSSCSNLNGILSATVLLTQHDVTIMATLDTIELIGCVRIGLSSARRQNGLYTLKELDFREAFCSQSERTLAQEATINMALTKAS